MPEIESSGNQPQSQETSTEVREPLSFLDEQPESNATEHDKAPGSDGQEEGSEVQSEGSDEQANAEESEAPSLPEWLEDYDAATLAKFQKRYPSAWKRLGDPNTSEDDRFLIRDKINADIEFQRLKAQDATGPTREEAQQSATPAPAIPVEQQRAQYQANLKNLVQQVIDPASVETLGKNLLAGFGVDISSEEPEVQGLVKNASKVGSTLVEGAADLMTTLLPHILTPQVIDGLFPGFSEMYETAMYARQWDAVRSATENGLELPEYGKPEFGKALREAADAIPGFEQMVFTDKQGRALPPAEQAKQKYQLLAKHMSGQKMQPAQLATVREAVETGQKIARRTEQSRAAGKALGAGRSKNQVEGGKSDWFKDAISEYNESQRSSPLKG